MTLDNSRQHASAWSVVLLAILGIVIGISSVIAMVSIGAGASSSITSRITSLGSNLIQISPGAQRTQGFGVSGGRGNAKTLTQEDADAICFSANASDQVTGTFTAKILKRKF